MTPLLGGVDGKQRERRATTSAQVSCTRGKQGQGETRFGERHGCRSWRGSGRRLKEPARPLPGTKHPAPPERVTVAVAPRTCPGSHSLQRALGAAAAKPQELNPPTCGVAQATQPCGSVPAAGSTSTAYPLDMPGRESSCSEPSSCGLICTNPKINKKKFEISRKFSISSINPKPSTPPYRCCWVLPSGRQH